MGNDYLLITPDRSVLFPSVEFVRNVITKASIKKGLSAVPVVIDAKHIQAADYTAAKVSINTNLVAKLQSHNLIHHVTRNVLIPQSAFLVHLALESFQRYERNLIKQALSG